MAISLDKLKITRATEIDFECFHVVPFRNKVDRLGIMFIAKHVLYYSDIST